MNESGWRAKLVQENEVMGIFSEKGGIYAAHGSPASAAALFLIQGCGKGCSFSARPGGAYSARTSEGEQGEVFSVWLVEKSMVAHHALYDFPVTFKHIDAGKLFFWNPFYLFKCIILEAL